MFDTVLNLKAVEAKVTSRGQLKHGRGGKNIMNREISEKEESYEVLTEDNDSGLLKKKKKYESYENENKKARLRCRKRLKI